MANFFFIKAKMEINIEKKKQIRFSNLKASTVMGVFDKCKV